MKPKAPRRPSAREKLAGEVTRSIRRSYRRWFHGDMPESEVLVVDACIYGARRVILRGSSRRGG